VREEIVERLMLRDPAIVVRGFDRPNLRLAVERFHDENRRDRAVLDRVMAAPGTGILYTATRRRSEELAAALRERGLRAAAYHAGLPKREREHIQESFMDDELDAVVATTAFGMGVDKPNVRWVFHAEVADSIDSYWQEAGRAGRDGEPSEVVLHYRSEDLGLRRFFAGSGQVDVAQIAQVAEVVLEDADGPVEPAEIKEQTDLSDSKIATAVARLEEARAVEVLPDGEIAARDDAPSRVEAIEEAALAQQRREAFDRSRVDMMRSYAETTACRREFVLSYFGEPYEGPCGACDNCEAGVSERAQAPDMPSAVGARVRHASWGEGTVQRYDDASVVVLFDDEGYKTLAVNVVLDRKLLEAA
jgi:ATP-dependent DNA helicase RecQ